MVRNNVGIARISNFRGNELACFDRLPRPLRRALQEGVVDWDARTVRWLLNQSVRKGNSEVAATAALADAIVSWDEAEVRDFSHAWPSRFGRHSPHRRAEATIMRYDEAALRRLTRAARGPA